MSIVERFDAAVAGAAAVYSEPELLPVRLAIGCVRVLPVAGAGLSAWPIRVCDCRSARATTSPGTWNGCSSRLARDPVCTPTPPVNRN